MLVLTDIVMEHLVFPLLLVVPFVAHLDIIN